MFSTSKAVASSGGDEMTMSRSLEDAVHPLDRIAGFARRFHREVVVVLVLEDYFSSDDCYFKNKYDHDFTVEPASKAEETVDFVHRVLKEERDIVIASRPSRRRPSRSRTSGWPTCSTRAACRST